MIEVNSMDGNSGSLHCYPPVLDVCCSVTAFWFDKTDDRALFCDKRSETIVRKDTSRGDPNGTRELVIAPDVQCDFTDLPFPNETFCLVVFDPPHKKRDADNGGFLVQQYGRLTGDWKAMIRDGFSECFRVLKPSGVLVFKWAETEFPLRDVLALTEEKPLFGHRSGKTAGTHWVCFLKSPAVGG